MNDNDNHQKMHILIFFDGIIPAVKYGGTERMVWSLGRALKRLGHEVTYLVLSGSRCDFAPVAIYDPQRPLGEQIPEGVDLVHFHSRRPDWDDPFGDGNRTSVPYVYTEHTNGAGDTRLPLDTIFISRNHALRHGGETFVYNGLEWDEYGVPDLRNERSYYHFLGNAAWRVKNVRGAIDLVRRMKGQRLTVLGGRRFNVKMGVRLTFSPKIRFAGMVGGEEKARLLEGSKGLIFPVRWHEPFGLAVIESLYFGSPAFCTPYGSLPELVIPEVGFLSADSNALRRAALDADGFSRQTCHDYVRETFSADRMAEGYIACYERVLNGERLQTERPVLIRKPNEPKFLPWV